MKLSEAIVGCLEDTNTHSVSGTYHCPYVEVADTLFPNGLPDGIEVHWARDDEPRIGAAPGEMIRDGYAFVLRARPEHLPDGFRWPRFGRETDRLYYED